ncbi:MAG: hypothetical protein CSA95_03110 [Bacteroidetes bacterium]|nr:MAG: hypothetical protein CSA95_03110 [Bacteroidota bacterium]PIE88744.1 MAG: hypothetical protein CSA04_00290 [Bacteroidota bacterium]
MKRIIFTVLLTFLAFSVTLKAQNQKINQYAIKSGHVKYKLTGNTEGTKEIWFDNYGDTQIEEENSVTTVKIFGMKDVKEKHTRSIMQGPRITMIDFKEKKVTKSINPLYEEINQQVNSMTEKEQEAYAKEILESLGGEIIGEETILNKRCEITSLLGSKVWVYKGVSLKIESKILGIKNFQEATLFKEKVTIPSSLFDTPKGFEVQDLSEQTENFFANPGELYEEVEEEEEEEESYPVEMPYEMFQKAMNKFEIEGYNRTTVMNLQGEQYMAVFMKSLQSGFSVLASSMEGMEEGELKDEEGKSYDTFYHKRKKMYYFEELDQGIKASILMVQFPKYNTNISLVSTGDFTKQELIDLFDRIDL